MSLPGVSMKKSIAIGLLRSLALFLDILVILYVVRIICFVGGIDVPTAGLWGIVVTSGTIFINFWQVVIPPLIMIAARVAVSSGADEIARRSDESVTYALTSDLTHSFLVPRNVAIEGEKEGTKPNQTLAMLDTEGIKTICSYFSVFIPNMMEVVFMLILAVIVLTSFNGWVALIIAIGMVAMPLFANMIRDSNLKYLSAHLLKYDKVGLHFEQASRGLSVLTIFKADKRESEKIEEESEGFRRITMQILKGQLRSLIAADFVIAFAVIVALIVTVMTSSHHVVGIGVNLFGYELPVAVFNGIVIATIGVRLFIPERSLIYLVHDAAKAMKLGKQIVEARNEFMPDFHASADLDDSKNRGLHNNEDNEFEPASSSSPLSSILRISHLSVAYEDNGFEALHDISFDCDSHGFVGIAGRSGSGKSTLLNVLTGRLPHYAGSATINGREISSFSYEELSHAVVAIRGNDKLFAGTIASNMDLAQEGMSAQTMIDALKRVDMWSELEARGGLSAHVAAGGANFSGGQRQRLNIARGLARKASIYLFDEATSAVDAVHDAQIERLLVELSNEYCIINVTHRLSNIRRAQSLVILDSGIIAEQGTFDALIQENGLFAHQWKQQQTTEQTHSEQSTAQSTSSHTALEKDLPVSPVSEEDSSEETTWKATQKVIQNSVNPPAAQASTFKTAKRMASFLGSHRPTVGAAAVFGLIGHLCSTASVMLAIYSVYAGFTGSITACWICGIIAAIAALTRGVFSFLEQYFNHEAAFSILRDVRVLAFNHVRKLSPAGVVGKARGNLVTVLTEDVELLEVFYAHTLSPLMIALGNGVIMSIVFAVINPWFGLLAFLSYLIIGVGVPSLFVRRTSGFAYEERQSQGRMHTKILDYLEGKRTLLQFNANEQAYKEIMDDSAQMLKNRSYAAKSRLLNMTVADVTSLVLLVIFAFVALTLSAEHSLNVEWAVAAVCGFATSFPSLISVSRLGAGLQPTLASARRVFTLLDEVPSAAPVEDGVEIAEFSNETAKHLSFGYSDAENSLVLRDLNMNIKPGDSIAIQGPNGAGKTTLLDNLMRFRLRSGGELSVNGVDINDITTETLRTVQTLSGQDVFIFDDTLRANIAIANPSASDEEILQAAHRACLDELIDQLPEGLNTQLTHNGSQLSDGQRQRVTVARSFLSNAQLMFFDEPTSNMDALLEAELMQTLMENQGDKAYVFVSHRESTLAYARSLYVLRDGVLGE